ncbi:MAG: hypothetical protein MJZ26_10955 [Fibrobacter sp.]|nr:hypothetical protein [Fibrobacter sp.]
MRPSKTTSKKRSAIVLAGLSLGIAASFIAGCADINNSWEVKGGGYFKYTIDGEGPFTIDLAKNDVEPPFYVNNMHHYFFFRTRIEESKRGDQFSILVNNPSTNGNLQPVERASVNGRYQNVSWMRQEHSIEAPIIPDSSYLHFDEIINDSLWTADVELYFKDCRSGTCRDSLPPVHVSGRLRYWVPESER